MSIADFIAVVSFKAEACFSIGYAFGKDINRNAKIAAHSPTNDMYPFYWTSSERGIFMRYTYEFKKKAVELYRQGKWIDAPNDIINLKNFHDMIVRWHHLEESNTSDCLKHCGTNKKWSPEEKYELVARVIAGDTITSVAYTVGINSGLLAQWISQDIKYGVIMDLVDRRKRAENQRRDPQ